jgi:hypothetical protein
MAAVAQNNEATIVLAAGLLSATASLPLHLMPAIVATLVSDHVASVEQAGWIASAVLLGQMAAALSLPALGVAMVSRRIALAASIAFLLAVFSTISDEFLRALVGWFLAGVCCGILQHLGLTTAAASARPSLAFALRLGVVMIVAGAVAGALRAAGALESYASITTAMLGLSGALIAVGLCLYRPVNASGVAPKTPAHGDVTSAGVYGLLALMVLFAGQTGFLAYVMQDATGRGLALPDTLLAMAAIKVAVGVWLIYCSRRSLAVSRPAVMLGVGAMLALSVLVASSTEDLPVFIVAFLGFELAFNTLAAAALGSVATALPTLGRSWLTATILIGAAVGPPAHGAVLASTAPDYFVAGAMMSALLPGVWAWRLRKPAWALDKG